MNYFDISAISNSSLGYIDPLAGGNPRQFKRYLDGEMEKYESSGFELGTLVHQMILEPDTIDMEPVNVPGPKVKVIIDKLFAIMRNEYPGLTINFSLEESLQKVNIDDLLIDFYKSRSTASKHATLIKEGSDYWFALCESADKTLVSPEVFQQVHECVDSIQRHEHANHLLIGGDGGEYEEALNECEITWTEEWQVTMDEPPVELEMKAKLDRVLINHTTKTIALVDLKTTRAPLGRFNETLYKYEYHRQLAFYQFALSRAYPGYTIDLAYIIAIQTNKSYPCDVFLVDESWLEVGWQRACQLINRICFHKQLGNWSMSQEALLGGAIKLTYEDDDDQ